MQIVGKLIRHVVGFNRPKGQNGFVFTKNLDYKLFPVLQKYSFGEPILVFVSTRKAGIIVYSFTLKANSESES